MFAPYLGCELLYPRNQATTIYPDREAHDSVGNNDRCSLHKCDPYGSPVPSAIPKAIQVRLIGD